MAFSARTCKPLASDNSMPCSLNSSRQSDCSDACGFRSRFHNATEDTVRPVPPAWPAQPSRATSAGSRDAAASAEDSLRTCSAQPLRCPGLGCQVLPVVGQKRHQQLPVFPYTGLITLGTASPSFETSITSIHLTLTRRAAASWIPPKPLAEHVRQLPGETPHRGIAGRSPYGRTRRCSPTNCPPASLRHDSAEPAPGPNSLDMLRSGPWEMRRRRSPATTRRATWWLSVTPTSGSASREGDERQVIGVDHTSR